MSAHVPSLWHGSDFNEALERCIERISIIDMLDDSVNYPACVAEWYGLQLQPLHELRNFTGNPWHNVPTTGQTPPPMVNVAWAILDCQNRDEELLAAFKELMSVNPGAFVRPEEEPEYHNYIKSLLAERYKLLEYAAVLNFQETVASLLIDSQHNQNESAMLKLAQIDKSIIYSSWFKRYIITKQYQGDADFFERLGKALAKPILTDSARWHKAAVIAGYFWDEFFSKPEWPMPRIFQLFKDKGILVRQDNLRAFKTRLNHAGLKKPRYNQK